VEALCLLFVQSSPPIFRLLLHSFPSKEHNERPSSFSCAEDVPRPFTFFFDPSSINWKCRSFTLPFFSVCTALHQVFCFPFFDRPPIKQSLSASKDFLSHVSWTYRIRLLFSLMTYETLWVFFFLNWKDEVSRRFL